MSLGGHLDGDSNHKSIHNEGTGVGSSFTGFGTNGNIFVEVNLAEIEVRVMAAFFEKYVDMLNTLTRCQEECTRLLEENRGLNKKVASIERELAGQDATFDMRWKADMRAIKMYQEAHPERGHAWPDHADMVVWLLEQLDAIQLKRPASNNAYYAMRALRDATQRELDALKKEYDEEVISHDLEEKGLKAARDAARSDFKNLTTSVQMLFQVIGRHDALCQSTQMGALCDCNYHERRRTWKLITGVDV